MHSRAVTAILALAAVLLPAASALACPLLDDGANSFQGTQPFSDDFRVATTGTLTVSISGVPSQNPLSDYSFDLVTLPASNDWAAAEDIATLRGAGSVSIPVTAGTIYGVSFNQLAGAFTGGVSSVELLFQPGDPSPVPLPASLPLLFSALGLGALGWSRRGAPTI